MFTGIKSYLYGAIAAIVAGLGLALKIVAGQRNKARQESDRLRRRAEAVKKQRDMELRVHNAGAEERKKAREHAKAEKERIDNDVRPDSWGDKRLRVRTKKH